MCDMCLTHGHCGQLAVSERLHVAVNEKHVKHICYVVLKHANVTVPSASLQRTCIYKKLVKR